MLLTTLALSAPVNQAFRMSSLSLLPKGGHIWHEILPGAHISVGIARSIPDLLIMLMALHQLPIDRTRIVQREDFSELLLSQHPPHHPLHHLFLRRPVDVMLLQSEARGVRSAVRDRTLLLVIRIHQGPRRP